MKNIIKKGTGIIVLLALIFMLLPQNSYAKSVYSWYTPRNGTSQPRFSTVAMNVKDHAGYYIDTGICDTSAEKRLYITFDFGYENGNVEKIVDVLNSNGVKAAFFVLDNPILKNTALIKKIADSGHLICNHTKNHKDLTLCSSEEISKNITDLEKIYEIKTGYKMAKYFRFPEGKYSYEALDIIKELGYKTVFWSFAYADWDNENQPSREAAIKKIMDNTHNGAVILLHPTSEVNANIMNELISRWRAMGYTFGTLDQLCESCDSARV